MTFEQWKEANAVIQARAERIRAMRVERARRVWDAAFGGRSQDGTFFLYAHNWSTLPTLTPQQRHACRFVKHMDEKQWEGSRIADRIVSRLWLKYRRAIGL